LGIYKVHIEQPWHTYHSASACQILSKSNHPRQSYDVISFFQDGGHGIAILIPVLVSVTLLRWEGWHLPA